MQILRKNTAPPCCLHWGNQITISFCISLTTGFPLSHIHLGSGLQRQSQALRDCFVSSYWDLLQGSHGGNIKEIVDCTIDYLNFCMDFAVPVCCFANNKPWITGEIKGFLKQNFFFKDDN